MEKRTIPNLGEKHFSDFETKDADKELGDELALSIGDTYISWREFPPCDQWTQVVKALRLHGLKITRKPPSSNGEAITGPMAFFLNQLFLCAQSFSRHVKEGSIRGRHQVEGILQFLDHEIAEFADSTFTFNVSYNHDLACMVLESIVGEIAQTDTDYVYCWEWKIND